MPLMPLGVLLVGSQARSSIDIVDSVAAISTALAAITAAASLAVTLLLYYQRQRRDRAADARARVSRIAYLFEELDRSLDTDFFIAYMECINSDDFLCRTLEEMRAAQFVGIEDGVTERRFDQDSLESVRKRKEGAVIVRLSAGRESSRVQQIFDLIRETREECFLLRNTFPALHRIARVYFRHMENLLANMDAHLSDVFFGVASNILGDMDTDVSDSASFVADVQFGCAGSHAASVIGGGQHRIESIKSIYNLVLPIYLNDRDSAILSISRRERGMSIPDHKNIMRLDGEIEAVLDYYIDVLSKADAVEFTRSFDEFKRQRSLQEIQSDLTESSGD